MLRDRAILALMSVMLSPSALNLEPKYMNDHTFCSFLPSQYNVGLVFCNSANFSCLVSLSAVDPCHFLGGCTRVMCPFRYLFALAGFATLAASPNVASSSESA